jgi:hypothetical protein
MLEGGRWRVEGEERGGRGRGRGRGRRGRWKVTVFDLEKMSRA